jgi:hypothetical protein
MNSKTPVEALPIQYLNYLNKAIVPLPTAGITSHTISIFIPPNAKTLSKRQFTRTSSFNEKTPRLSDSVANYWLGRSNFLERKCYKGHKMPQYLIHVLQVLALVVGLCFALRDHRDDFTGSLSKRTLGLLMGGPFFAAVAFSLLLPQIGGWFLLALLILTALTVSRAFTDS